MSLADDILARELFPTNLDTQGIRERVPADIRRRALFSAKTTEMQYLARMREVLAQYVDGEIGDAEARSQLRSSLLATGYEPGPGETGLRDRSSERRLNLILQTTRATAASCAQLDAQTPALLELFPAWRLERFESRMRPRADWAERWRAAGQAVEWEGASRREMVALKSSPIWQALGSGAGGFDDTLGNPVGLEFGMQVVSLFHRHEDLTDGLQILAFAGVLALKLRHNFVYVHNNRYFGWLIVLRFCRTMRCCLLQI